MEMCWSFHHADVLSMYKPSFIRSVFLYSADISDYFRNVHCRTIDSDSLRLIFMW
jgi:hypothetical protein